jgi:hypothetical protein
MAGMIRRPAARVKEHGARNGAESRDQLGGFRRAPGAPHPQEPDDAVRGRAPDHPERDGHHQRLQDEEERLHEQHQRRDPSRCRSSPS